MKEERRIKNGCKILIVRDKSIINIYFLIQNNNIADTHLFVFLPGVRT
jgi:hypothetical protein